MLLVVSDTTSNTSSDDAVHAVDSLAAASKIHEAAFGAALDARNADSAVAAILELESAIVEWSRDTLQSDDRVLLMGAGSGLNACCVEVVW